MKANMIAGALALTLATPVRAEPYVLMSLKPDQMFVLYTGTVAQVGPYKRAWVGIFSPKPTQGSEKFYTPIIKIMFEWDCAEKRHRELASVAFDGGLSVVEHSNERKEWAFLPPGSIYGGMSAYMCESQGGRTVYDHDDERILANYRAALQAKK